MFLLCLAKRKSEQEVRGFLYGELSRWSNDQELKTREVKDALPISIKHHVKRSRGAGKILEEGATLCREEDEKSNSIQALATLYIGIAMLLIEEDRNGDATVSGNTDWGDAEE